MIIKNFEKLAISIARKYALEIINAGIERVLPKRIIRESLRYDGKFLDIFNDKIDISKKRIFVIGAGKASCRIAQAVEEILGDNIVTGYINCKKYNSIKKIRINIAEHPTPNKQGIEGVKKMLSLKGQYSINRKDIIICLISGGGSALMTYPVEDISLEEIRELTKNLLNCGAKIQEINKVRKHLSKVKGGKLAKHFYPAKVISLILSDVIGDDLDVIASGPTVSDSSTFLDAYKVLKKYSLLRETPKAILNYLKDGISKKVKETPKKLFNVKNYIIGNNKFALEAMAKKAKELGLDSIILTSKQTGETSRVANKKAEQILKAYKKYKRPIAIILGGETTVTLPRYHGIGGRNQEYVLASLLAFKNLKDKWSLISVNTDGYDFIEECAGAIIDNNSFKRTKKLKLNIRDYLDRHDSYNLLKKINSLVLTGSTGTNVCDITTYVLL